MINQELLNIINDTFNSTWAVRWPDYSLIYIQESSFHQLAGYPLSKYLNEPLFWLSLIHPEDREIVEATKNLCLTQEFVFVSYRIICQDNSIKWVLVKMKLLRDENNSPTQVVATVNDISHVHRVQSQLQQSFKELNSFFSITRDILVIIGRNGKIHRVNRACSIVLGYLDEEVAGLHYLDFMHPEDIPRNLKDAASLNLGMNEMLFEYRFRCKNGEYKVIQWKSYLVDGVMYSSGTDVTEERANLIKLDESETNFYLLCEHSPLGIFKLNSKLQLIYTNRKFEEILGLKCHEFKDEPWEKIIHPDDVESLISGRSKARAENRQFNIKVRIVCASNEIRYLNFIEAPLPNQHMKKGYIGTIEDITDATLSIQRLEYLKNLLEDSQAISKIGSWNYDYASDHLIWTKEAHAVIESSPEEYTLTLDTLISNFLPSDVQAFIHKRSDYPFKKDLTFDHEIQILTLKGRKKWIRVVGQIITVNQHVSKMFGNIQDIDDQKRNHELLNLQREKLLASARMTALGEMTASIAHEINNPLAIITGTAMVLEEFIAKGETETEMFLQQIKKIDKNVKRVANVVRGLELFSRDVSEDPLKQVALTDVIQDSIILCQQKVKNTKVDFNIQIDNIEGVSLLARPTQISQVLLSLIQNSMEAILDAHEKWVSLHISLENQKIVISITDSGPRIPFAIARKLMTPFFTTKLTGKGFGLGLSIVKSIIEEHNGFFYFDGTSKDTRFVINLPISGLEFQNESALYTVGKI